MAKSSGSGKSTSHQGKNGPHIGFNGLATKVAKEYGSKAAGERVAGAVAAKIMKNKGK